MLLPIHEREVTKTPLSAILADSLLHDQLYYQCAATGEERMHVISLLHV